MPASELTGRCRTLRKKAEIALSTPFDRIFRLDTGRLLLTTCDASGTEVLAFQSDGTPLWSYSTGARVLASLAIGGDGTLYVSSDDHNLYAFAP